MKPRKRLTIVAAGAAGLTAICGGAALVLVCVRARTCYTDPQFGIKYRLGRRLDSDLQAPVRAMSIARRPYGCPWQNIPLEEGRCVARALGGARKRTIVHWPEGLHVDFPFPDLWLSVAYDDGASLTLGLVTGCNEIRVEELARPGKVEVMLIYELSDDAREDIERRLAPFVEAEPREY